MRAEAQTVGPFYDGWGLANQRLIEMIGGLSAEQLALRPAADLWPIWAAAAHIAVARVYWLCAILKEPGLELCPFVDVTGMGWEDDLAHPRRLDELIFALESSWKIAQHCLDRWTPHMLTDEFPREVAGGNVQIHTRQSVLMRLITHDGYHCGEISQTLGMHGLKELDIWTGRGSA